MLLDRDHCRNMPHGSNYKGKHMEKLSIIYATGNSGKFHSMRERLKLYGIGVKQLALDLPEPQTNDIRRIAEEKARVAYKVANAPVIVNDSGFFLNARNGFPGVFVKFAIETLGIKGFLDLVEGKDRSCAFIEVLAFYDGNKLQLFEGKLAGMIAPEPRGELPEKAWSALWLIFIPEGETLTLAEMTQEKRDSWRARRGNTYVNDFAKWFAAKSA